MQLQHFDLIIVGGGLVGAGLALALMNADLKIALIEANLPRENDPRLFALNYSSCQFLNNIGVWSELESYAAPIHQVHVSRKGSFGAVRLRREEIELSSLGHVIPAKYIERVMHQLLQTAKHLTVLQPAKLQTIHQKEGSVQVFIETNNETQELQANLLIGADGTMSTVRKQANIKTSIVDYKQHAIVTRTFLQRHHNNIAYERFTDNGTIAMLPLPNNVCATIWTADTETINRLNQLSDAAFINELQNEFGYRNGRFQSIAERHCFPLQMVKAEQNHDDNIILLGNAAHTLHPIAAQGFNLAIYEAAALADALLQSKNPFSKQHLAQALQRSNKQQSVSMGVSHFLSDIFMDKNAFSNMLLQCGMNGLDNIIPLKRKFIERMTGRAGHVPHLLIKALA